MSTAVIDKNVAEKTIAAPMPQPIPAAVREIRLDQIEPSPWNRKKFNPKALEELAASIVNTGGVVQPIVLRPHPVLVLRKSLVGEQHYIDVKGKSTGAEAYKNREAAEAELHKKQGYQIVAGERRWLASKIARDKLNFRDTITATVREMTDAQALEVTLTENAQREDVPVLELCRTYKALEGQKDSTSGQPYTRELIAERVKKSYSLVCAIMNADKAIPEVQKAAGEGKIGDSLVLEIAKYTPAQQMEIFLECFTDDYSRVSLKEIEKDKDAEPTMSVRQLRAWIAEHIHIELKNAPFDTKDEFLLKGVTSCMKCPKRTGSNPGLFAESAEMQKGDTCTDPGCYDAKKQAFVNIRIAEEQRKTLPVAPAAPAATATVHIPAKASPAGVKPLGAAFSQSAALGGALGGTAAKKAAPVIEIQKISSLDEWAVRNRKEKGVLYEDEYELSKPGCKKEKKAIYVDGPKIGQTTFICDVKSCSNHGYSSSSSSGGGSSHTPVTYERKLQIWNSRVQLVYRDSVAKGIVAAKPREWREQEAQIVCDYVLRKMDYRDGRKICRAFGLKEGSGSFGLNHGLDKFAKGLKGDELLRFILICAMESELGLEDQYFGGALKASDPLAVVATDYKVEQGKLLEAAKASLEKKRPKSKAEKKAAVKAKKAEPRAVTAPPVKKAKTGKTKKKK
jgi:ParB/RepB/Spo0J family partition protein